jgi:hypothetical protein
VKPEETSVVRRAGNEITEKPPASKMTLARALAAMIWHIPDSFVGKPSLSPDLPHLSVPARYLEIFLFTVRRIEYWLSPGGHLRGTLGVLARIVILAAAVLLSAAAILGVAACVTGICVVVSGHLVLIATAIFWCLMYLLGCLIVLAIILLGIRLLLRVL